MEGWNGIFQGTNVGKSSEEEKKRMQHTQQNLKSWTGGLEAARKAGANR